MIWYVLISILQFTSDLRTLSKMQLFSTLKIENIPQVDSAHATVAAFWQAPMSSLPLCVQACLGHDWAEFVLLNDYRHLECMSNVAERFWKSIIPKKSESTMTQRSKLTLLLQRLSRKKIPSRLSLVCLFPLPLTSFTKDTCKLVFTLSSANSVPPSVTTTPFPTFMSSIEPPLQRSDHDTKWWIVVHQSAQPRHIQHRRPPRRAGRSPLRRYLVTLDGSAPVLDRRCGGVVPG